MILIFIAINHIISLKWLTCLFGDFCQKFNLRSSVYEVIHSMTFLSPEVNLYLYKFTIRPCMEYCCHVWAGAPRCYLELLDKLQKRICRSVSPSLSASLKPLAHRRNMPSLSLFCRYYFDRCSSELAQPVPLPLSRGLLVILIAWFFCQHSWMLQGCLCQQFPSPQK